MIIVPLLCQIINIISTRYFLSPRQQEAQDDQVYERREKACLEYAENGYEERGGEERSEARAQKVKAVAQARHAPHPLPLLKVDLVGKRELKPAYRAGYYRKEREYDVGADPRKTRT